MSDLKVEYAPGLAPPDAPAKAEAPAPARPAKPARKARPRPEKGSPAELADKAFMRNRKA